MTLLDEFEKLLSAILSGGNDKKTSSKIGPLDVSSNVSVKVGLDELASDKEKGLPALPETEPLIDFFEKAGELKIVVYMPGIREEDAIVRIEDGMATVQVRKGLQVYRKDFPCTIGPQVVMQTMLSNSVLEIACRARGDGE
jgi:HSP20 family molecular chaperone IbpA